MSGLDSLRVARLEAMGYLLMEVWKGLLMDIMVGIPYSSSMVCKC